MFVLKSKASFKRLEKAFDSLTKGYIKGDSFEEQVVRHIIPEEEYLSFKACYAEETTPWGSVRRDLKKQAVEEALALFSKFQQRAAECLSVSFENQYQAASSATNMCRDIDAHTLSSVLYNGAVIAYHRQASNFVTESYSIGFDRLGGSIEWLLPDINNKDTKYTKKAQKEAGKDTLLSWKRSNFTNRTNKQQRVIAFSIARELLGLKYDNYYPWTTTSEMLMSFYPDTKIPHDIRTKEELDDVVANFTSFMTVRRVANLLRDAIVSKAGKEEAAWVTFLKEVPNASPMNLIGFTALGRAEGYVTDAVTGFAGVLSEQITKYSKEL